MYQVDPTRTPIGSGQPSVATDPAGAPGGRPFIGMIAFVYSAPVAAGRSIEGAPRHSSGATCCAAIPSALSSLGAAFGSTAHEAPASDVATAIAANVILGWN